MMLRKLTSAMILLGAAGMANAAYIYVDPTSPTMPIVHAPQQTDWTATDVIAQFNPANHGGARLNSVHIEDFTASLKSDGGTVFCITADGNDVCTGSVDASVAVTLTGPAGLTATASVAIPTFNYNITGAGNSATIPASDLVGPVTGVWYCIVADMPGCVTGTLANAIVAAFEGSGTVNFGVLADGIVTTTNNTGFAGGNYPLLGDATYRVRYDYMETPMPEPMSLALLGLGLAGIGVARRRKV